MENVTLNMHEQNYSLVFKLVIERHISSIQFPYCCINTELKQIQGNRRLHFARAVHSRHPFLPTGDAVYRQHAGRGPSHGHRQHAQKFGKDRAYGSGDILADRQTDTQTDILITILHTSRAGEVTKEFFSLERSSSDKYLTAQL